MWFAALLLPALVSASIREHKHGHPLPSVWTEQIERNLRPFKSGILLQDVDFGASIGDYRVVIKNNALYVGPGKTSKLHNDELDHAVFMLIAKALCYQRVDDVDFVLNLGDWPLVRSNLSSAALPVMSWTKSEGYLDIFFPYWSFTWLHPVPASFHQPSWSAKSDIAVWRGSTTGGIWTEPGWRNLTRAKLSRLCNVRPDLCDAKINGYVQGGESIQSVIENELGTAPRMKIEEMCAHKYIIVVDGNGPASSRLVSLLTHCHSVLLVQETQVRLFWMAGFQPFVHYIPVAASLDNLLEQIEWARANDDAARQIAENAHEFALKHINDAFVSHYVIELLRAYAEMQSFDVQVRPGMYQLPRQTNGWNSFFDYMKDRCHHFFKIDNVHNVGALASNSLP